MKHKDQLTLILINHTRKEELRKMLKIQKRILKRSKITISYNLRLLLSTTTILIKR